MQITQSTFGFGWLFPASSARFAPKIGPMMAPINSSISVPPFQGLRFPALYPGLAPWAVLSRPFRAKHFTTAKIPKDYAFHDCENPEGVAQQSPGREPWDKVTERIIALKGRRSTAQGMDPGNRGSSRIEP